jgi:protein-disulfide isomerase/uncharacterized membrane protein
VIPQSIAVLCCLAAAFVSFKLLAKHVTGSSGSAWFEAGCGGGQEHGTRAGSSKAADCAAVLASPHSYWPPKKANEPPGTPHVPVAFLGLMYFTVLGVWLIGVGRTSYRRRSFHMITLIWVVCGLAGSLRYVYVMFTQLGEWCPWCLAVHGLNLVVVVCTFLLWPLKPRGVRRVDVPPRISNANQDAAVQNGGQPAEANTRSVRVLPVPSAKRVAATLAVMLAVAYGNYGQYAVLMSGKTRATLQRCVAAVKRIKADAAVLVADYDAAGPCPVAIGPEAAERGDANSEGTSWNVVVFSDFLCPACRRFAAFFETKVAPLFDGRLRLVFRHYPLDPQCNQYARRTTHPGACAAAYLAAAAGHGEDGEAFWRAHDLLFALPDRKGRFTRDDAAKVARDTGIDRDRLATEMQSPEVAAIVARDIESARQCGVTGTPAIFLNGKRVDSLATMEIGFWNEMADRFWTHAGEPRPASTMRQNRSATRDTPDRKGAP